MATMLLLVPLEARNPLAEPDGDDAFIRSSRGALLIKKLVPSRARVVD